MTDLERGPSSDGEYQPRTPERLIEILKSRSVNPRSYQREAATLISELQAERDRLNKRLDLLAVGFGVCDGGKFIADWQTKIAHYNRAVETESNLSRIQSETVERCAKIADKHAESLNNEWNRRLGVSSDLIETCQDIADDIRSLKLPDCRGGEAKTAEGEHSPSTREG